MREVGIAHAGASGSGNKPRRQHWKETAMKAVVVWAGILTLRLVSRVLPVPLLRALLLPPSILFTIYELFIARQTARSFGKYAGHFPRSTGKLNAAWRFFRMRINLSTTRFARYWPDQLGQHKWKRRIHLDGLEQVNAILDRGTSVILATLHYGCLKELFYTLRSVPLRIAALEYAAAIPPHQQRLESMADQVTNFVGLPYRFNLSELWGARDFLKQPGNVLLIVFDAAYEPDVEVGFLDSQLRIATGIERMAYITGATIIPCLFQSMRGLEWRIWFGSPTTIAGALPARQRGQVCTKLLRQLEPMLAAMPELAGPQLLDAIVEMPRSGG